MKPGAIKRSRHDTPLARRRHALGLSEQALAEVFGVHVTTVRNWTRLPVLPLRITRVLDTLTPPGEPDNNSNSGG